VTETEKQVEPLGGTQLLKFAATQLTLPKRRQWKFPGFLLHLYLDPAPVIYIQKAAQLGISTYAITRMLYAALSKSMTVMYVLPSEAKAGEFVRQKVDPMIEQSPICASRLNRRVNNISFKKLGSSYLIFTGSHSKSQALSTDVDFLILDEFSFLPNEVREMYEDRTQASLLGYRLYLSVPSDPATGIEALMRNTKQYIWAIECRSCNRTVPLIPDLFEVLIRPHDGSYAFYCPECDKLLDPTDPDAVAVRDRGKFIALKPEASAPGYLISSLYDPRRPAKWFIEEQQRRETSVAFYRAVLGISQRLPIEGVSLSTLTSLIQVPLRTVRRKCVGIDTGREFHWVMLAELEGGHFTVVGVGRSSRIELLLRELRPLEPDLVIIDALPLLHEAKQFTSEWGPAALTAQANRKPGEGILVTTDGIFFAKTDFFHELMNLLQQSRLTFSPLPQTEELLLHIARLYRTITVRATGGGQYRAVALRSTGTDHFAHALILALVGLKAVPKGPFSTEKIGTPQVTNIAGMRQESFLEKVVRSLRGSR